MEIEEVSGTPVKFAGFHEMKFFVHQNKTQLPCLGWWQVCDAKTGIAVSGFWNCKKTAIRVAGETLEHLGIEKTKIRLYDELVRLENMGVN
jgi:hypothetical protein